MTKTATAEVLVENGNEKQPEAMPVMFKPRAITYETTDSAIAALKAKYKGIAKPETTKDLKVVTAAIADSRTRRTGVDKRRKELKRDAIAYGKQVESEAGRITALLLEIEEPLKFLKTAVDEERERKKREAEEARLAEERRKIEAEREEQRDNVPV